jgi:hypothetical protein
MNTVVLLRGSLTNKIKFCYSKEDANKVHKFHMSASLQQVAQAPLTCHLIYKAQYIYIYIYIRTL